MPLRSVEIKATLEGSLANVDFDMTYMNPSDNPIECTYEFPLEADTLLTKLVIYTEDKQIEAMVLEKGTAEQIYEYVKAEGDLGVFAKRQTEEQQFLSIKVGNLLPGKEIKISAQLVQQI